MNNRKLSVHVEHEVLLKLEAAGLEDELAQRVIDSKDNELATKVVRLIRNGGFEPTTSQKRGREIMGRNFFGVEEAIKHFGVNPTREQIVALAEIPFSEAVLQECAKTHILIAVFPMSILDIRGKVQDKALFCNQDWYNSQAFAKDRGNVAVWQLVRKAPVSDSTSKTWEQQQALLGKDEETPTARVMVYTIIGHFLATGERFFKRVYARCQDVSSLGSRICVGHVDEGGLDVGRCWDGAPGGDVGLASARKIQSQG